MKPVSYEMYTRKGDAAIAKVIEKAKLHDWTWKRTYEELVKLSKRKGTEEATDTAVREVVYDALRYTDHFYL